MGSAILTLAAGLLLAPEPGGGDAGACARCHISVTVEWNISAHRRAGITCIRCHGPSEGHVVEERNGVKPDRMPTGSAVTAFCRECHASQRRDSCQTCHHVHALLDPRRQPAEIAGARVGQLIEAREAYRRAMQAGEAEIARVRFHDALGAFEQALRVRRGDPAAAGRIRYCQRRLHPDIPGFRPVDGRVEESTGLPAEVEVAGLGIRMLAVAGGSFDLGDDRYAASRPVHQVRVGEFFLGRTEVTQAEWEAVMGTRPSFHRGDASSLPVENVSWNDCQEFLTRLNARVPGGGFRLPTEAEWEYAARTGSPAEPRPLDLVAWYRENVSPGARSRTDFSDLAPRPVGSKTPNARGFFDMQGNVWEWCSSVYRPFLYDAADGREDPLAPGTRVLRGGSYADSADILDPALRHWDRPGRRYRWNGLRVARSVPPPVSGREIRRSERRRGLRP